jgi:hypothetical protein
MVSPDLHALSNTAFRPTLNIFTDDGAPPAQTPLQLPSLPTEGCGDRECLKPQEAHGAAGFMNGTLAIIEQLRRPLGLPDLKTQPASDPALNRGGDRRTFFHGSHEECRLMSHLQEIKRSCSAEAVDRARGELHRYWRRIIDGEYDNLSRRELSKKWESSKSSFEGELDPFRHYRLHGLAKRGRELHDQSLVDAVDRLRSHAMPGPTGRGRELARYAEEAATGGGGQCYAYVAKALDRLGISLSGESAYMAAEQLARRREVREIKLSSCDDLRKLPAGAVVVWNRNDDHCHGHISIALGRGLEASDVVRSQITDYGTSFRVFIPLDRETERKATCREDMIQ